MPDIHHSISIAATGDVLRELVSTAPGMRQWWAEDVEALPDGVISLGFFERTTVYRLHPLERSPARVAWECETGNEWQGTDLVFTLQPEGSGILLGFAHARWREASSYFVSCNTTWGGLMFRLKSAAEGRHPGPLFRSNSLAY